MLMIVAFFLVSCSRNNENFTTENTKHEAIQKGDSIQFGEYEWVVLNVYENNTALIISKSIVNYSTFINIVEVVDGATWENSDLRMYLNGTFMNTFSEEERNTIISHNIYTPNNEWYGTRGGNNTVDYIFLLSIEEVVRYFGDSGQLKNPTPTGTAIRQWLIDDEYNSERLALNEDSLPTSWWLRSSGFDYDFIATVMEDGSIRIDGTSAENVHGARPAMIIRLQP
ncbi:MAG: DUF6273 domain-containing protein [Defluviitaleaceae bacterium]|nr:DUF6273 domain-containing protein [Defluviitaleaceae bacterium]